MSPKKKLSASAKKPSVKKTATKKPTTTPKAKGKSSKTPSTRQKSEVSGKLRRKTLLPEEMHPFTIFPYRLEYKDGKDLRVCHFECEEHRNKHIKRYGLRKNQYFIDNLTKYTNVRVAFFNDSWYNLCWVC